MRIPPLALGLAGALLLARAALAQPAQPTPAPAPPAVPAAPRIAVNDPLLDPPAAPAKVLGGWRDALMLIAARSSELHVAVLEVERAQGISREALGRALPQIDATGRVTHHMIRAEVNGLAGPETVPKTPTALAQVTLAQPILAPRAWHAVGTAERAVEAARLNADDRRRTLVAATAGAIVSVVTAERVAEINRVGLRSALELQQLFQRQLDLGSGKLIDVVRAEQDVNVARATLITGDEALRQAREALGLTLGSTEAYGVPTTISLDELARSARETCEEGTPDRRADVRAARAELAIAERAVTDARLLYAPTAEVSTTATLSTEPLQTTYNYSWSIQGVISIPIWDGGSRYGTARAARAGAAQQRERVEATQRVATLESSQAARSVHVAQISMQLSEKARDLSRQTAKLTQRAFESGAATSFELVETERRVREVEADLAVRELELIRAKITALLASANCTY